MPYLAAVEGVDPSKRLLIARTEFEALLSSCKHNFLSLFIEWFWMSLGSILEWNSQFASTKGSTTQIFRGLDSDLN